MSYLVDTNVLSELRKGPRCDPHVRAWFAALPPDGVYLSVLVIGEMRRGVERIHRRDARSARALGTWLERIVRTHSGRILPIDQATAQIWGRFDVTQPVPVVDGLLAATALIHGLTLATRNVKDVARTGVTCVNPFE